MRSTWSVRGDWAKPLRYRRWRRKWQRDRQRRAPFRRRPDGDRALQRIHALAHPDDADALGTRGRIEALAIVLHLDAQQAIRRAREYAYIGADNRFTTKVVTIHAHQHWKFFRTGGEFYPRVAAFADCLVTELPGASIECFAAGDTLGDEDVAVIMGDVPAVAANIELDNVKRRFVYRGRPAVFMGNPNLLPN